MKAWMKWIVAALSLGLVALLFALGPEYLTRSFVENRDKVSTAKLQQVFSAVQIHPGDKVGERAAFDKEILTGVTTRVISEAPPQEVLSFYRSTLPLDGWISSESAADEPKKAKFCKNRTSLIVEVLPNGKGADYYLGVTWTSQRMSPFYCH